MEINASVDEQERMILAIALGALGREAFVEWLKRRMKLIASFQYYLSPLNWVVMLQTSIAVVPHPNL